jgi:NAD+ kinase
MSQPSPNPRISSTQGTRLPFRMQVGLILLPRRDAMPAAETIVRWAGSHGAEILVDVKDAARCPDGVSAVAAGELAQRADALVSIGGDGTMLGALRLVAGRPVPVLGVNLGRLGFLVEVEPDDLMAALDRIERRDFTIEEHGAVVVSAGHEQVVAFNEIALTRVPGEGLVQAALVVDGRPAGHYRCDALVIATPTGSTAYSYAAGGPVVSPALDAVIVSVAAPLSGVARPVVVSAAEPLQLGLLEESGRPALEADGILVRRAEPGERLDVRLRPGAGQVVRLDPERYQRRKQVKLSLLDLPFLPDEMRDLLPPPPGSVPDR